MAFSLICFCDETQSKRVWMILAFHAAANGVLNVFAFGYLEHSLVAVTTVYTSLDVLAVLLISRIPTNIAKGQFALLGVLIIHQWITLAAVNEPLVLAIAICQLLLGYNAMLQQLGNLTPLCVTTLVLVIQLIALVIAARKLFANRSSKDAKPKSHARRGN